MKYYVLNVALIIATIFCTTACNGTKKAKAGTDAVSSETSYNLTGNEPFWNVRIEDIGITFTQMGGDPVYFPAAQPKVGSANSIYNTSTEKGGRNIDLRIIMEKKPCSDSMADKEYAYKATVVMDGKTFKGCAEEVKM